MGEHWLSGSFSFAKQVPILGTLERERERESWSEREKERERERPAPACLQGETLF